MKYKCILVFLAVLLASTTNIEAQRTKFYVSLEFLKISAATENEFLGLDKQLGNTFADAIKKGDIVNRALVKLWYPGLHSSGYNYLNLTTYKLFGQLQNSTDLILQHHGEESQNADLDRYMSLRTLVKREITEVWRDFLEVKTDSNASLVGHLSHGQYLHFQYLKVNPQKWDEYVNLEKEIWTPIHTANSKKVRLKYWALFGYWFEQRAIDYDLFSVFVYPKFERLETKIHTRDTWNEVHGAAAADQIFKDTYDFRTEVHSEVWRVISVVKKAEFP